MKKSVSSVALPRILGLAAAIALLASCVTALSGGPAKADRGWDICMPIEGRCLQHCPQRDEKARDRCVDKCAAEFRACAKRENNR
jgi:hypothetical protein